MRPVWTIFKKEWDRVVKDKRLVLTVMLLPGMMIFLIYSFMGGAIGNLTATEPGKIAVANPSAAFTEIYSPVSDGEGGWTANAYGNWEEGEIAVIALAEIPDYESRVDAGTWDLVIVFPEGMDGLVESGYHASVQIYFNQNEQQSSSVYARFMGYLSTFETVLSLSVYGDTTVLVPQILGPALDENRQMGLILSSLLPMLVVMFLFSGAMSIGPESIAGEKERGTMATLLITPVKRSQIALGKVLSLGILSLISALSSFLGILFSIGKLFGAETGQELGFSQILEIYGAAPFLFLLVLLFSTVFVIVGLISIVSAYAKNVKEAGTLIIPLYLVTIIVGVSSMFSGGAVQEWWWYLIPIFNTVQSITALLMSDPNAWLFVLLTVAANLALTAGLVYLLTRMFESERIMFAK